MRSCCGFLFLLILFDGAYGLSVPSRVDLSSTTNLNELSTTFVILGGTGQIGTAVASHLQYRRSQEESSSATPSSSIATPETEATRTNIILVGRRPNTDRKVQKAIAQIKKESSGQLPFDISYRQVESVWNKGEDLQRVINEANCVIHAAGPYFDQQPVPLECAIESEKCSAYVDISDPLPYLELSLLMTDEAKKSGLTAVVAAGAFPGFSNVLAMEAAQILTTRPVQQTSEQSDEGFSPYVQDVRFHYFTAGLGGSGNVNLYITNRGFGEPMVQYENGQMRFFMELSGLLLGAVDFFLSTDRTANKDNDESGKERSNSIQEQLLLAQERIGRQRVFAWPFPEAATVPLELKARGNSYASMGTAPDIWNTMLGILVGVIPKSWWRSEQFSKFMADFSEPLVRFSDDIYLRMSGVGETHAIRIDVTGEKNRNGVSIVHCHDSFRRCVGQSCAEFALDALSDESKDGVYLPEQLYRPTSDRDRILGRLTTTPGTFCYTGPIKMNPAPEPASDWALSIDRANRAEAQQK